MGRAGRIGAAWCAAVVVALAAGCSGAGAAAPSSPTVVGGTSSAGPVRSTAASSVITAASSAVTTASSSPPAASSTTPPSSSAPASSPPASSSPPTGWTTPDYGDLKPAVDTYLKVMAAGAAGLMDPEHPDMAVFDKYTQGQAKQVMVDSIQDEVTHGTAWRGTPWTSRVEIKAKADGAYGVILTDCPLVSASWVQYDVATGQTTPQKVENPPPPYLVTAVLGRSLGTWTMSDFRVDGSKTCTR